MTLWDEVEPGPEPFTAEERRRMDKAYQRIFGPPRKLGPPRFGRRRRGVDMMEWHATHSRYLESLLRGQ